MSPDPFAPIRALIAQWRVYAKNTRAEYATYNQRLIDLANAHAARAEACADNLEEVLDALLVGAPVPTEGEETQGWRWPETGNPPTDKELARVLPTLPLERRIETVIRKYVGGAVSRVYDGETAANVADREIAEYLLKKLRPWLPNGAHPIDPPGAQE